MAVYKHQALIITGLNPEQTKVAHEKAHELYKNAMPCWGNERSADATQLISPIIKGVANDFDSFFIAPDGGGRNSDYTAELIATQHRFIEWLVAYNDNYQNKGRCDYVQVLFGGDTEDCASITAHNDMREPWDLRSPKSPFGQLLTLCYELFDLGIGKGANVTSKITLGNIDETKGCLTLRNVENTPAALSKLDEQLKPAGVKYRLENLEPHRHLSNMRLYVEHEAPEIAQ